MIDQIRDWNFKKAAADAKAILRAVGERWLTGSDVFTYCVLQLENVSVVFLKKKKKKWTATDLKRSKYLQKLQHISTVPKNLVI